MKLIEVAKKLRCRKIKRPSTNFIDDPFKESEFIMNVVTERSNFYHVATLPRKPRNSSIEWMKGNEKR